MAKISSDPADPARQQLEAEREAAALLAYTQAIQSGLPEEVAQQLADQAREEYALGLIMRVFKKFFPQ